MRTRRLPLAGALVLFVLSMACGEQQPQLAGGKPASSPEQEQADEHDDGGDLDAPPPVTVRYGDDAVELEPWTFCYANGCADGMPPEDPHDVGSPEEVVIDFPLSGWSFNATFKTAGEECGREFPAQAEPLGDGSFVLRPAGYAGSYDVTLFGKGDGDLFVTFRWTTRDDGPLPQPKARMALLAEHDGKLDSYGVELMLSDLAQTPEDAAATITVRASNGDEVTFEAKRARSNCWPEGTVYWDGPDDEGMAAEELPGQRFTYEVDVTLDGEHYVGTAIWPDDVIKGNEPSARLEFEPELPALQP